MTVNVVIKMFRLAKQQSIEVKQLSPQRARDALIASVQSCDSCTQHHKWAAMSGEPPPSLDDEHPPMETPRDRNQGRFHTARSRRQEAETLVMWNTTVVLPLSMSMEFGGVSTGHGT